MKFLSLFFLLYFLINSIAAQIAVEDEPLHHVLYEDAEIRILEIVALPGDTAAMHQHNYNYCYIATAGGKMWLEDAGEEGRIVTLPTHYAGGKFELEKAPFVHRFANIDTAIISFFTIEHKVGVVTHDDILPLPNDSIMASELFAIRKLSLPPLSARVLEHDGTAVLLNLSRNPLLHTESEHVVYWKRFDAQEKIQIHNMSEKEIIIALFEVY